MRFWVLAAAVQIAVLAVLGHRFFQQEGASALAYRPARSGGCGLLRHKEFVLTSRSVVLPEGAEPAAVRVKDGLIADIAPLYGEASKANLTAAALLKFGLSTIEDYGDLTISPGLIDTHVHFNEPGREVWEGYQTGSKAAAAGGTTTVILMPLNALPAVTTGDLMRTAVAASENKLWVDAGFWGGLVPENAANHSTLLGLLEAGALGFKSFMSPSGIVDFGTVDEAHIAAALPFLKAHGAPFYVHAELPDDTEFQGDARNHSNWERARPPEWEQRAIRLLLSLLGDGGANASPGFQVHIAHLSDTTSLPRISEAKAAGVPITVETCPHYLNFVSEEVAAGDTRFKCAPPIRGGANRAALWQGVVDGPIDSLASDHSPSPPEMKSLAAGDFNAAWGGIAALQYNLPATWDGMSERGLGPELLTRLWSEAPARLAGLDKRKGSIARGYDADFVVWDPKAWADTSEAALQHRHKLSPYRDARLRGRVEATFVRGQQVFAAGQLSPRACGRPLLRGSQHGILA